MTQQELNSIFDKALAENLGKKVERVDPNAYAQCFDWAIYWCEYLGFPKTIFSGLYGAHEIYDKWSHPSFEKIPNSTTFVPQKGDICVWSGSLNGGIGHVAVATGKGDTTYFESADQNWVVGNPVTLVKHSYNYFLGVQRYKVSGATPPMNDKRPGWFDLLSKTEFGTTGWEKLTDAQISKWASDLTVRKTGNGKWDQICAKAGLPTSSTPDQVAVKLQGNSFDKNKFLEAIKALLFP